MSHIIAISQPPPSANAADRGDDRLAALRDPLPAAGDEVLGISLNVGLSGHLLDVGAGGEGPLVAGQDDRADRRIGFELVERGVEVADQRGVEGVERLRPVEGDDADRARRSTRIVS